MHRSLLPCLALLHACTSAPPGDGWVPRARAVHERLRGDYPGASELVHGFTLDRGVEVREAASKGPEIRNGDQLLYGLVLDENGRKRRWLLLVTIADRFATGTLEDSRRVTAPIATPSKAFTCSMTDAEPIVIETQTRRCEVTVRDVDANTSETATVLAPVDWLSRGLLEPAVESEPSVESFVRALAALMGVVQLCKDNESLAEILWQVVDSPGLLSIVLNFGVSVSVDPQYRSVQRGFKFAFGPESRECWDLPLEVLVNDSPALRCTLRAVQPVGALATTAGVVSVAGFRPSDESTRFRLELLGSRREPEPVGER